MDADRQIKLGPGAVSREHVGGIAANGEGQAASVTEGKCAPADERAHRAGKFGVGPGDRLYHHLGRREQSADTSDFDFGVYEFAYDLGQVRRAESSAGQVGNYQRCTPGSS